MRHTPILALCALLACACATRPPASLPDAIAKEIPSPAPVPSTESLVNSGQETVVDRKLAAIAEFSVLERDKPRVIENDERGPELLAAPAAVQVVLAVKARILEEFKDPRFVAVHQKLVDSFRTIDESDLSYETGPAGERAVTSMSLVEVLQKLGDLTRNVTNQADVRTTFTVNSEPPGAAFELCPQYLNDGCIHVSTDATIVAIYRGRYTYRVSLVGFRTIAYPLDLVHFTHTRLDCRLQARRVSPCTPR